MALSLVLPATPRSQSPPDPVSSRATTSSAPTYPDTIEGLRLLLTDMSAAARSGDQSKLDGFVRDMEIPDYEVWFTSTYGQEKGESWSGPYGDDLKTNNAALERQIAQLAQSGGEFVTRKVNDHPQPGKGLEWGMLQALNRPVDIFFAAWRSADARKDSNGDPIGYFVFVNGGFRWDSTIRFLNLQRMPIQRTAVAPSQAPNGSPSSVPGAADAGIFTPGKNGAGYPSCANCPVPQNTREAQAAKIKGVVLVTVVVQPEGHPTAVEVVKGMGYGLDEAAVAAVQY